MENNYPVNLYATFDSFNPRDRVRCALQEEIYQFAYSLLAFRHLDEFEEICKSLFEKENKK